MSEVGGGKALTGFRWIGWSGEGDMSEGIKEVSRPSVDDRRCALSTGSGSC